MALSRVVAVLIPAASYDLVDLDTVKDELKITTTDDDAFLARAITQVSALAQQYCNRVFPIETVEETVNLRHDPFRYAVPDVAEPLQLTRWPLADVQGVTETAGPGTTEDLTEGDDYEVAAAAGQLLRLGSLPSNAPLANAQIVAWKRFPVIVTYDAGYETIPADIVNAVLRLITHRWFARGRDPLLLERVQPTIGTERWWVGGPKQGGTLPDVTAAAILDNYRVPVAG